MLSADQLKALRNNLSSFRKSLGSTEITLLDAVAPYTMIPPARVIDAYHSAKQVAVRDPGASVVEFGVFAGGGLASMAYGVSQTNFSGNILGFDTFEGHVVKPNRNETDIHGNRQDEVFEKFKQTKAPWAKCDLETVNQNLLSLNITLGPLPPIKLVNGNAIETCRQLPSLCERIGFLRLDMDWYEPTKSTLVAASPLLASNAVVVFDDYGHHSGVRDAADEFMATINRSFNYSMVDYSCLRIVFLD
jgi:hypothetical protein